MELLPQPNRPHFLAATLALPGSISHHPSTILTPSTSIGGLESKTTLHSLLTIIIVNISLSLHRIPLRARSKQGSPPNLVSVESHQLSSRSPIATGHHRIFEPIASYAPTCRAPSIHDRFIVRLERQTRAPTCQQTTVGSRRVYCACAPCISTWHARSLQPRFWNWARRHPEAPNCSLDACLKGSVRLNEGNSHCDDTWRPGSRIELSKSSELPRAPPSAVRARLVATNVYTSILSNISLAN